jgi:2-methylcitrate dehydratase PrpD
MAVAAHRIRRGPGWQTDSVIRDPRIRAFMKKVRHEVNPRSEELRRQDIEVEGRPYLSHRPANVVIMARGRVFERSVDHANWLSMGVDAYRASDDGLAEKFKLNAEVVLSDNKAEDAIATIMQLEAVEDLSPLMETLV